MKKGLQSSLYDNLSLKEEINIALSEHVDFFDIFFDTWTPAEIPEETYKLISDIKISKQMDFTVHMPINFYELGKSQHQLFYKFISFLKPKTITIHFNTLTYDLLNELVTTAAINNSVISVENTIPDRHEIYKTDYLSFMKEAEEKLENIKMQKSFGATIDTGHAFVNGINPEIYIQELTKNGINISTVHLHDNDGTKDSHQPLGTGKINFRTFFTNLKKEKLSPYMVIEHWTDFNTSLSYLNNIENYQ